MALPSRQLAVLALSALLAACGNNARPPTSGAPSSRSSSRASASANPTVTAMPGANGFALVSSVPLAVPDINVTMTFDSASSAVYLDGPASLTVFNTRTKSAAAEIDVPGGGVTFDEDFAYVASGKALATIRKDGWTVASSVSSPQPLTGGIWADPSGRRLYATTTAGDVLVFASGASPSVAESFHVADALGKVGAVADNVLYAADGGTLCAVDLTSGQVGGSAQLGGDITGLAYDQRNGYIWATTSDHHLQALRASGLDNVTELDAPTSSGLSLDSGLRVVFTFGPSGFGAYDTNNLQPWAQVDTGGDQLAGAADTDEHDVYLYASGELAIYAWGAGGVLPASARNGGGTSNGPGGGGGGGTAGTSGATSATGQGSAGSGGSGTAGGSTSSGNGGTGGGGTVGSTATSASGASGTGGASNTAANGTGGASGSVGGSSAGGTNSGGVTSGAAGATNGSGISGSNGSGSAGQSGASAGGAQAGGSSSSGASSGFGSGSGASGSGGGQSATTASPGSGQASPEASPHASAQSSASPRASATASPTPSEEDDVCRALRGLVPPGAAGCPPPSA